MKRVRYVGQRDDIDFYLFTPTIFSRYWFSYTKEDEPDYWKEKNHSYRMIKLLLFNKYRVLYAVKNHITVGHMVISRNYNEVECATRRDIIIGPKWVAPSCRGNGYGTVMLKFALESGLFNFDNAYEMISSVNYASIRVVEKCGYIKVTNARRGKFGKIIFDKEGSWRLYRYSK